MTKLKTMIAIIAISIFALGAYSFAETNNKNSKNQNESYENGWDCPGYGYRGRWNNTDNKKNNKRYRRMDYRGGYCWE